MDQSVIVIKDNTANPAPLGLLAFGLTTVLLNLHNAGIFEMNSMILAMGIFMVVLHKLLPGLWKRKKIILSASLRLSLMVLSGSRWLP